MGNYVEIFKKLHKSTHRDFVSRMLNDKAHCMEVARRFDQDFFDGERRYGFGGYHYDGRWLPMAKAMAERYNLGAGAKILEVGCGKGYLLYEFTKIIPGCIVSGFDISEYAVASGKEEIRDRLFVHDAGETPWPFEKNQFDLVFSVTTLHNLPIFTLKNALAEIERVGKHAYICVEGYRTPAELFALQCWALTAECFFSDTEWQWLFNEFCYSGDFEFIHF